METRIHLKWPISGFLWRRVLEIISKLTSAIHQAFWQGNGSGPKSQNVRKAYGKFIEVFTPESPLTLSCLTTQLTSIWRAGAKTNGLFGDEQRLLAFLVRLNAQNKEEVFLRNRRGAEGHPK